MKVIDLLNKIANGEDVPEKVKWKNIIFKHKIEEDYEDYINDIDCSLFRHEEEPYKVTNMLNDEVEVIEEDKKIEKLDIYNCFEQLGDSLLAKERLDYNFNAISDKINEIIDKINEEK